MPEEKSPVPGVTLNVRVIPRAPRDALAGWQAQTLKVRLRAPPVAGRANAALVSFLAEVLEIPRADVVLLTGATSRCKRVLLRGVTAQRLAARLGTPPGT